MADTGPVARSPIAPVAPEKLVDGWVVSGRRSSAALTLTDCTPLAKVAVKAAWNGAAADTIGVNFGRASSPDWGLRSAGDVLVIGSGPGEWLVLAAPGQQSQLAERLRDLTGGSDELVSVVDLTHGRALIRLLGQRSADLLAKECGVDLTDEMCPDGAALRSAVAGLATDIARDDRGGIRSYLLHCERSSGQYLFDSLLDAGREFGADVEGFSPPDS